jgi:acyl-CoA reductase-like NAD-dependent aldehyde dehydrogenase
MLRVQRRSFANSVLGPNGKKHKLQTKLLIDGKWQDSVSGKTFAVVDPSTGLKITRVAAAQKEDVDLAVKAAQRAFTEGDWAKMSPLARQDLMVTFANQILARADELTAIECNDNGKTPE